MAGVAGKSGRKANEQVIRQNLVLILDQIDPQKGRKRMLNILHALVSAAEEGKMDAINAIMDRVDGKPKQQTEVSGPDGGEIPVSLSVRFGKP